MNTEHQPTPEEEAHKQFLAENWEVLSGAARTILDEAELASYTDFLIHNVCFQPEEYDEAMEKMKLAATEITDRDLELLWRLSHLALAASASIDPRDRTPVGFCQSAGNPNYSYRVRRTSAVALHYYYRVLSDMVWEVVEEDWDRLAQQEQDLGDDSPF